ncbi:MAG: hypothetical protein EOP51_09400 [Sphingobacteriales bacterium]|nr:MAG: hypothetical protein EOP51_09400 [Sphingobacteriales bacterium]
MFTPAIKLNGVDGTYINNSTSDNATRFSFNNIGIVFNSSPKGKRYERSAWKSSSFAIGINRVADFNRNYTYNGTNRDTNTASSFAEKMAYNANMYPEDLSSPNSLASIGYNSFLVDTFFGSFYSSIVPWKTGINQRRTVKERGGITDIVLSFGGNLMEKLMLGATVGLPTLTYRREVTYEERDATTDPNNYFDNFSFNENLTTTGLGINLKLGFIYKPVDAVRIGAAFHTPTYFGLTDVQNRGISANTEGLRNALGYAGTTTVLRPGVDIPENTYEYGLTTPWRGVLSASGIVGKYGFITADYEYVNYASMRFKFPGYTGAATDINTYIKNNYKGASNFRIGAEGRIDMFMVRLGFGYYGNPYKNLDYDKASRIDISGGVGFRADKWFIDLGFVNSTYNQQEQPYTLDELNVKVPTATLNNKLNTAALTLGWKF